MQVADSGLNPSELALIKGIVKHGMRKSGKQGLVSILSLRAVGIGGWREGRKGKATTSSSGEENRGNRRIHPVCTR